ncbi:MAG: phytoene desaturase family protein, partial [Bacteroidota bacterium]
MSRVTTSSAAVLGAGIGGLAAAIRLRLKGYDVRVFEQNAYPGGKLTSIQLGEYRFDAGPSLCTLPDKIDAVFLAAGRDPREYISYKPLEESCRYFWEDGTVFCGLENPQEFAAAAHETFGVDARKVLAHLADSRNTWETTRELFLERSLHKPSTYTEANTFRALAKTPPNKLFSTLNKHNERLEHPKLIQIFNRFATYNGSDPYRAPAMLSLIPHLEHGIGAVFPEGGMHAIT